MSANKLCTRSQYIHIVPLLEKTSSPCRLMLTMFRIKLVSHGNVVVGTSKALVRMS